MSVAVDRDQAFLDARCAGSPRRSPPPNADDVDRDARFPGGDDRWRCASERALSAFIPRSSAAAGSPSRRLAAACFELGRRCGASAMVFAMHQIQVVTIVRHLEDAPWFEDYLRDVASRAAPDRLGDLRGRHRRRHGSLDRRRDAGRGRRLQLREAGADRQLRRVRRRPADHAAPRSGRRARRPGGRAHAHASRPRSSRPAPGTRSACAARARPGYVVRAEFAPEQVLATPFPKVSNESMVPVSHILWSHLWLGIATDAFDRARAFVRAAAKRTPGETAAGRPPPVAPDERAVAAARRGRLGAARVRRRLRRARPRAALDDGARRCASTTSRSPPPSRRRASARARSGVCGIMGFKNDTPFSVGRHLRDTMSARLMVANERIHQTNASLLLIAKDV